MEDKLKNLLLSEDLQNRNLAIQIGLSQSLDFKQIAKIWCDSINPQISITGNILEHLDRTLRVPILNVVIKDYQFNLLGWNLRLKIKDGHLIEICTNLDINKRLECFYLGEYVEDKIANILAHFLEMIEL